MKHLVIGLGALTLIATITTVILSLIGQPVLAVGIGTMTLFFWLAMLVVSVVAVTTWWTRQTMAMGADLALRSQESDDRRDIAQVKAIGDLAKILMRQTQPDRLALPLPSQQADDWLPELAEFQVIDGEVGHD